MKGTVAVFGTHRGRNVASLMRDGQLDDLLFDPPDNAVRPGAIYRAKARRLLKGLGGAILDTPHGSVFLRNAKGLGEGQTLFVQVTTYAEREKATPVTSKIVFKSRFCLATPGSPGTNISRAIKDELRRVELQDVLADLTGKEIGVVVRSAAATADNDAVRSDVVDTLKLAHSVMREPVSGPTELLVDGPDAATLAWREWEIPDATDTSPSALQDHGVLDALDDLASAHVSLGGSGSMFVEATRALVSIDVNTGQDFGPAAALKANVAAAKMLPRELRLRGLGGQIVADFAPMPKKERHQVESALRGAFRHDAIETSLVGWTTLGMFEMQRKRERVPVLELLS